MNKTEHLLICLAEECAEVAQRVSKALRFGLGEIQMGQPLTNAERISQELHDLIAVALMLEKKGVLKDVVPNHNEVAEKDAKVRLYMRYAKTQGALE